MKKLIVALCALAALPAAAQEPSSKGVYRIPYADGVALTVTNDHANHTPPNRLDLVAASAGRTVVAAAAGRVRIVVQNNNTFCRNSPASLNGFDTNNNGAVSSAEIQAALNAAGAAGTANRTAIQNAAQAVCNNYNGPSGMCCMRNLEPGRACSWAGAAAAATCQAGADGDGPNNYIWIEHPNGEWTKYTHIQSGSAQVVVNQQVAAGDPLGLEGDVGIATGRHLHFEVAGISSADEIDGQGWLVDVDSNAALNLRNRVPVFCQFGVLQPGEQLTAKKCDDACESANASVTGAFGPAKSPQLTQVSNAITSTASVGANGGLALRAGERITLAPGFRATGGGAFSAEIGACDAPGGSGE